jgi:hypothetical protein
VKMPRIVSAFSCRNRISHIHKSVPEEQTIIHKSWRSFIAIVAIMVASVISINQCLKSKPACECIGSRRKRGGIHINKSMPAQDELYKHIGCRERFHCKCSSQGQMRTDNAIEGRELEVAAQPFSTGASLVANTIDSSFVRF